MSFPRVIEFPPEGDEIRKLIVTNEWEAAIIESSVGGFNALKALSRLNENPAIASSPFDIHWDGFVIGEGAGAVILESYDHAVKRNALKNSNKNVSVLFWSFA